MSWHSWSSALVSTDVAGALVRLQPLPRLQRPDSAWQQSLGAVPVVGACVYKWGNPHQLGCSSKICHGHSLHGGFSQHLFPCWRSVPWVGGGWRDRSLITCICKCVPGIALEGNSRGAQEADILPFKAVQTGTTFGCRNILGHLKHDIGFVHLLSCYLCYHKYFSSGPTVMSVCSQHLKHQIPQRQIIDHLHSELTFLGYLKIMGSKKDYFALRRIPVGVSLKMVLFLMLLLVLSVGMYWY